MHSWSTQVVSRRIPSSKRTLSLGSISISIWVGEQKLTPSHTETHLFACESLHHHRHTTGRSHEAKQEGEQAKGEGEEYEQKRGPEATTAPPPADGRDESFTPRRRAHLDFDQHFWEALCV